MSSGIYALCLSSILQKFHSSLRPRRHTIYWIWALTYKSAARWPVCEDYPHEFINANICSRSARLGLCHSYKTLLRWLNVLALPVVVQADKELIAESIAIFDSFDQNANNLDHKLRMFGSSMQLMGFSVGVQNATYHARKALMRLQFHVRENVRHSLSLYSMLAS